MKEIGKLLELLNDYEDVKTWYATYTTRGEESEREIKSDYMFDEDQNIIQIYIISKDFGFIKWLVENDKINEEKVKKEAEYYWTDEYDVYEGYVFYHRLLMLLSVSDTPIEFLISILK